MRLELPPWFLFWFWYIGHWYLTLGAAILFAVAGWYCADWLRGFRWAAFGAAALLTLPFPLTAAFMIYDHVRSARAQAELVRILNQGETIAGLALPSGSEINFRDKAHLSVYSIVLPHESSILGMPLTGALVWNESTDAWGGTLAADRPVSGWPCRAGPIEFSSEGTVQSCVLAAAHGLLGYELPAGTSVTRGGAGKAWRFWLPAETKFALPALPGIAPGGVTLAITGDGRLEGITDGRGQTITVRGVPLNCMNLYVRGGRVLAALAEPFEVAGEIRTAGTGIQIDLDSGEVALARKNWWLSD